MSVSVSKGGRKKKAASVETSPLKDGKFRVMLGNDCARYLTPDDKLYERGKQYAVTEEKRKELFGYVDDNGVRYFYDADVILRQIEASKKKGRRQTIDEESEEDIDTGAMSLTQEDGTTVGKRGSNVAV